MVKAQSLADMIRWYALQNVPKNSSLMITTGAKNEKNNKRNI